MLGQNTLCAPHTGAHECEGTTPQEPGQAFSELGAEGVYKASAGPGEDTPPKAEPPKTALLGSRTKPINLFPWEPKKSLLGSRLPSSGGMRVPS